MIQRRKNRTRPFSRSFATAGSNQNFDQLPVVPSKPHLNSEMLQRHDTVLLDPTTTQTFPKMRPDNNTRIPARGKHSFYVFLFLLDDFMNP